MPVRYFTVAEANALLPKIEPLMAELLERRAKAVRLSKQITSLLQDTHVDFGGVLPTEIAGEFALIEELHKEIKSHGCIVKNLEAGLVDFLAQIDGRDVYLCWRYGENQVQYYHELHTGFRGRKAIE
jgi:hypothetical protein